MRTHILYLDSDTNMTFKHLNNALNGYADNLTSTLVESLEDGSYLVLNRGLTGPYLAKTKKEVETIVNSLY